MFVRISPNKCSKFLLISLLKSSVAEKRHGAMQKLFKKREKRKKKKELKKNGQVFEISKTMGTQMPT